MLFFANFGNNKFDEDSSYQTKLFKEHMAVKEMISFRDEMDTLITQKYLKKRTKKCLTKKRKD